MNAWIINQAETERSTIMSLQGCVYVTRHVPAVRVSSTLLTHSKAIEFNPSQSFILVEWYAKFLLLSSTNYGYWSCLYWCGDADKNIYYMILIPKILCFSRHNYNDNAQMEFHSKFTLDTVRTKENVLSHKIFDYKLWSSVVTFVSQQQQGGI